jgi:hypothetical protein
VKLVSHVLRILVIALVLVGIKKLMFEKTASTVLKM